MLLDIHLLGHGPSSHSTLFLASPSMAYEQFVPPNCGGGSVQVLVWVMTPAAQVVEQEPLAQADQPPSTSNYTGA